jgi:hypothetical protein
LAARSIVNFNFKFNNITIIHSNTEWNKRTIKARDKAVWARRGSGPSSDQQKK